MPRRSTSMVQAWAAGSRQITTSTPVEGNSNSHSTTGVLDIWRLQ
ncbi:MAG: hypothetical protein ABI229_01690 [Gemmatimonadaceae bacterium]